MPEKRHSRFDPDYEEETGNLFEGFEDTDDEYSEPPKRSRFEDDHRPLFGSRKKRSVAFFNRESGEAFGDSNDSWYAEEEEKPSRFPFLVRMFIWLALVAAVFAIGYYAANYFIGDADDKNSPGIDKIVGNSSDIALEDRKEADSKEQPATENVATTEYKLYIPNGKDFTVRRAEITHGRTEEDMARMLAMYFDSLREAGLSNKDVHVIDLFKSDDLAYLNLDSGFEQLISALDEKKASDVVTGLLSVLWNNFSVKKVKFYINAQESGVRVPVNLSQRWGL